MTSLSQKTRKAYKTRLRRYRAALKAGKPMTIRQPELEPEIIALYREYNLNAQDYHRPPQFSQTDRKSYNREYYRQKRSQSGMKLVPIGATGVPIESHSEPVINPETDNSNNINQPSNIRERIEKELAKVLGGDIAIDGPLVNPNFKADDPEPVSIIPIPSDQEGIPIDKLRQLAPTDPIISALDDINTPAAADSPTIAEYNNRVRAIEIVYKNLPRDVWGTPTALRNVESILERYNPRARGEES